MTIQPVPQPIEEFFPNVSEWRNPAPDRWTGEEADAPRTVFAVTNGEVWAAVPVDNYYLERDGEYLVWVFERLERAIGPVPEVEYERSGE